MPVGLQLIQGAAFLLRHATALFLFGSDWGPIRDAKDARAMGDSNGGEDVWSRQHPLVAVERAGDKG